jgi:ankyrin repeat protein
MGISIARIREWLEGESDADRLVHAASLGETDRVMAILGFGVPPDAQCKHGHTALYAAAANGHAELARQLCIRGADVRARSAHDGEPVIVAAARTGNIALVDVLLAIGADVNAEAPNGLTPLFCAIAGRHVELASLLVARGAWMDHPMPAHGMFPGLTPATYAAQLCVPLPVFSRVA